ncbi:VanZ family protein [Niabella ginsengisoli]|uniref:VanZ family protein n=1 Tax=Niabella ginsengisoli TaxID=522298 RepID=A0ABS9SEY3_9BACT|nr:VanZ family protein [Niabella ginsengisoli]MCH5596918.1 VanZ family protein [Niabella ginsengisoli]
MKKLSNSYWPAIFWSAIIVILLVIPGSDLPEEASFLNIPYFDKWIHFGLFALFVVLWCAIVRYKSSTNTIKRNFILVTLTGILFGYIMELVQKYLVANRDYDMWDVVADSAGAIVGLIFSLIVYAKK